MTVQKITLSMAFLVLASLFIVSCGNTGNAETATETSLDKPVKLEKREGGDISPEDRKEYASAYICPMHCKGSGSDAAGKCPVCGMDYVANENAKGAVDSHEGHDHDAHEGHDHGDHEGHNH